MRWQVSQSWGRSESPGQQAGKRTLPLDAELQGPTMPAAGGGGGGDMRPLISAVPPVGWYRAWPMGGAPGISVR